MKLGVIGCGKMGSALARGVVSSGVCVPADLWLYDTVDAAIESLSEQLSGAEVAGSASEIVDECDVVLLCVKPDQVAGALEGVSDDDSPLLVSIAAGVTIGALEALAGQGARVVRVMPNTPALVGKGASAFSLGSRATLEDAGIVHRLLRGVGEVFEVPEKMMDAVTGLSGSGPAYIYLIIEALADGGVRMGIPRDQALRLAAQTALGSAEMVLQTGEHPAVLRDQVTSPGGTTIAGIDALESGGLRATLIDAVKAATERSKELGNA